MSFDYPQTCPDIDSSLEIARDHLEIIIEDIVEEVAPFTSDKEKLRISRDYSLDMMQHLDDLGDRLRKTNSEMRKGATYQIEELEEEIEDLEEDLDECKERCEYYIRMNKKLNTHIKE